MAALLSADEITVQAHTFPGKVAAFSLDLETDFGTGRTQALSQLARFVDLMDVLDLPWTAFVEGQFFEHRSEMIRMLRDRRVDVQLHCYDHQQPGDTRETLHRSAASYADCLGHRPEGYRAHTYRLTRALFDALVEEGFLWDSSLMRAFAQGRNPHVGFRAGDYLTLNEQLVELPMATWRGLPIALNHSHLLLAKTPGELVLRAISGPPRLLVYNLHMTDLVRCDSLRLAVRTRMVKLLYRYLWMTHRADTFSVFCRFVRYVQRCGHKATTMSNVYAAIAGARVEAAPAKVTNDGGGGTAVI